MTCELANGEELLFIIHSPFHINVFVLNERNSIDEYLTAGVGKIHKYRREGCIEKK